MNIRAIILMSISLLLLVGCSDKKEVSQEKPEKEKEIILQKEKEEPEKKQVETKDETGLKEIQAVKPPETIEEFVNSAPGQLTKDFTYEKETASWPSPNTLKEIEEDLTGKLNYVTNETDDDDTIFKSLIYYVGNSAYQQVVNELISFKPQFDEPYLPEPEEETTTVNNEIAKEPKALIMLDASSSMLLDVDGEQKMKIAKSAVRSFAKTIGAASDVSLYVYGHAGSQENKDKQLSCSTIEEVYPLQKFKEEKFYKSVDEVEARGWTPLAGAIKKAREVSQSIDGDITLYIVSDGAETCDGNPIEEAKLFVQGEKNRKVNIIGFNVGKNDENQLMAVAQAGNGEYFSAKNTEELKNTVIKKWVPPGMLDVMSKQWSSPKGKFTYLAQRMDVEKLSQKISYAINVEQGRFKDAIALMESEDMITDKQKELLLTRAEEHQEKLERINDELEQRKLTEIDDEVNRIDKKINDWAERMEQLRKENSK